MKSLLTITLAAAFAVSGMEAGASPADSARLLVEPEVKLLSAKIENAIAELPETRTSTSIQNATFFILAKQDSPLEMKVAAIDTVIDRAKSIGDQEVVEALNSIELIKDEAAIASKIPIAQANDLQEQASLFKAPPSAASKGGSDY